MARPTLAYVSLRSILMTPKSRYCYYCVEAIKETSKTLNIKVTARDPKRGICSRCYVIETVYIVEKEEL